MGVVGWLRGLGLVGGGGDWGGRRLGFRLRLVERNLGLPVRGLVLVVLGYYFFGGGWLVGGFGSDREVVLWTVRLFFVVYVLVGVGGGVILWGMGGLSLVVVRFVVLVLVVLDVLFVGALVVVTEGFESPLYWVLVMLIVRNSVSVGSAGTLVGVNVLVLLCYLGAGLVELALDELEGGVSGVVGVESFFLRVVVLGLLCSCGYGVQALFDQQRRAEEEAQEHVIRQEQLQATGRLAAEIAHQLKNPLGIINNAAFNLQRTQREGRTITQQISIIREEVARSDRIITDLMGFARLGEGGRVEGLSVVECLDRAIGEVFPAGADFGVVVERDYQPALPLVFMLRGHLSEVFVNILQNAREAMESVGRVCVSARYGEGYCVVVVIEDDGPGMDGEALGRVFDSYYTTKERGTGLGLAIVKHNVEMYGGGVSVESELGRGTRFCLRFPARSLMRLRR